MNENELYKLVEQELREGRVNKYLWEKALEDKKGNEIEAEKEYIDYRVAELLQEKLNENEYARRGSTTEFNSDPSREPVKKRNIILGITILGILFVLVIVLGFLLYDYFN